MTLRLNELRLQDIIEHMPLGVHLYRLESNGQLVFVGGNPAADRILGVDSSPQVGKTMEEAFPHLGKPETAEKLRAVAEEGGNWKDEQVYYQDNRVEKALEVRVFRLQPREVVAVISDITERKRIEEQAARRNKSLMALLTSVQKLSQQQDLESLAVDAVRTFVEVYGANQAWVWGKTPGYSCRLLAASTPAGIAEDEEGQYRKKALGKVLAQHTFEKRIPVVVTDEQEMKRVKADELAVPDGGFAAFPLGGQEKICGAVVVFSPERGFFSQERIAFLQGYAQLVATSMENIRLLREAQQRMARITALRNIDLAISSSMDIHTSLRILLDEVVTQLGVDAATVLLFNPYTNMLEFTAGRGFRSQALQHTRLHLGEGNAGQAALHRKIVIIRDLSKQEGAFAASPLLKIEGFTSYFASPLLAKGQIKGVLEIFHRSPLDPDAEWLEFLETLAGQAAIAIDNAQMFNELQRSNLELELAYNHTLEGWVRALDMRDDETEGHTQRVTTATIFLARQMGMNGTMMEHLRRGALLHDIGKIAIPDHILRKPGPLTDEEWEIMRRHPVYAYEMLAPINYLLPALDIPYYHHERWDGSGYPNGLKGEQIPLPARIFAVIDVWDALNSDRPYRRAWPKEQVVTYIRTQSGRHFDPRVVEHFLELLPNLDRSAISQIIRT